MKDQVKALISKLEKLSLTIYIVYRHDLPTISMVTFREKRADLYCKKLNEGHPDRTYLVSGIALS